MNNITINITELERIMREWGAIPRDWRHFFSDLKKANIKSTPDWPTAPKEANFYAEDENCLAHWYKYRPSMGVAQWVTWGDKWAAINSNWESSLQQRPEKTTDQ